MNADDKREPDRRIDDYDLLCRVLAKKRSESLNDAARRTLRQRSDAWAAASMLLRTADQWPAIHRAARLARAAGYR